MLALSTSGIWSSFAAILAANAFLLTVGGIVLRMRPHIWWVSATLGIAGILICLAWFFTLKRGFAYFNYYMAWARSIEQKALGDKEGMLVVGKTYGEGAEVEIPGVGLQQRRMQMGWSAKVFKVEWLATSIIALFGLFYILLVILAFLSSETLCLQDSQRHENTLCQRSNALSPAWATAHAVAHSTGHNASFDSFAASAST